MTQNKQLSIIIVNFNTGLYTVDCIDSLFKQEDINFEIIVVDNASQDNSLVLLRENFADRITLIESKENLGFGRANNLAANQARGEYLLLLNPDTAIENRNALKMMFEQLKNNAEIGLLGPAIDEPRKNKQVLPRYSYPSSRYLKHTEKFKNLPGEIAWLLGACMLIKRSLFEEIKGFDPDYFLYGEDADICLKVRIAGYAIEYYDSVKITHIAGVSEFNANSLDKWLRKKRGVFLFCAKHYDPRDVLRIAKKTIFKSNMYLGALFITSCLRRVDDVAFLDKKHRLQASIIAAKEIISK
ncbi:MAG: glycosyltransferase family 2 protein [Methylotenera sp.]|uniref:glycosyltransferase family 2 protein n=1 Tax=Methylotenera sp. TaxID=2051956 RepID=UPI0024876A8B|nr:glycosyltransferase family 2 protein [Methylotenera sp.]MDI1308272.1 glycosyltransferase family 2 protein [Methylotenera sp.]